VSRRLNRKINEFANAFELAEPQRAVTTEMIYVEGNSVDVPSINDNQHPYYATPETTQADIAERARKTMNAITDRLQTRYPDWTVSHTTDLFSRVNRELVLVKPEEYSSVVRNFLEGSLDEANSMSGNGSEVVVFFTPARERNEKDTDPRSGRLMYDHALWYFNNDPKYAGYQAEQINNDSFRVTTPTGSRFTCVLPDRNIEISDFLNNHITPPGTTRNIKAMVVTDCMVSGQEIGGMVKRIALPYAQNGNGCSSDGVSLHLRAAYSTTGPENIIRTLQKAANHKPYLYELDFRCNKLVPRWIDVFHKVVTQMGIQSHEVPGIVDVLGHDGKGVAGALMKPTSSNYNMINSMNNPWYCDGQRGMIARDPLNGVKPSLDLQTPNPFAEARSLRDVASVFKQAFV
jgi:hypothetical protein